MVYKPYTNKGLAKYDIKAYSSNTYNSMNMICDISIIVQIINIIISIQSY